MDGTGHTLILQVGKGLIDGGGIGAAGILDGLEQHHRAVIAQCCKGGGITAVGLSVPGGEVLYLGVRVGRGEVVGEHNALDCIHILLIQRAENAVPAVCAQQLCLEAHFLGLDGNQGIGVVIRGYIQGIRSRCIDLGKLALEVGVGVLEALEGHHFHPSGLGSGPEGLGYAQGVIVGDVIQYRNLLGTQGTVGILSHGLGLRSIQEAGTEHIAAGIGDGSGGAGGGHHGHIVLGCLGGNADGRLAGDSAPQRYHAIALELVVGIHRLGGVVFIVLVIHNHLLAQDTALGIDLFHSQLQAVGGSDAVIRCTAGEGGNGADAQGVAGIGGGRAVLAGTAGESSQCHGHSQGQCCKSCCFHDDSLLSVLCERDGM